MLAGYGAKRFALLAQMVNAHCKKAMALRGKISASRRSGRILKSLASRTRGQEVQASAELH